MPLQEAVELCREHVACLVYLDFQLQFEARPHRFLYRQLDSAGIESMALPPYTILIDGRPLEPIEHFRGWRAAFKEHLAEMPGKATAIQQEIQRLRDAGQSWNSVAEWLNEQGLQTLNGKPWASDNVRKFACSMA